MQRTFLTGSIAALLLPASFVQAQLVQVAPGYVKAPFVRVYSHPDGSSYVRAPFVSVYSGGHYYSHGHSNDEFAACSWRDLARAIRQWHAQLENDLSQNPSGEFWRTSLHLADIAALVPVDSAGPPAETSRQPLRGIYDTFQTVSSSPDVNAVAGLNSFQMLRAALREYTLPADERARGQLLTATKNLSNALPRFETGPAWQRYLLLAPGLPLSGEQLEANGRTQSSGDLIRALELYEAVLADPQYRAIFELPSFVATHDALAGYVQMLKSPPAAPPVEELPAPRR